MNFRPHPAAEWSSIPAVRPGGCRTVASGDLLRRRPRARRGGRPMKAMLLVAIAALASGPMLADCRPTLARAKASAPAGATQPRAPSSWCRQPPRGPRPPESSPLACRRLKTTSRSQSCGTFTSTWASGDQGGRREDPEGERGVAARASRPPRTDRGALGQSGGHESKNELNIDLGERRAQAAMNYLIAQKESPRAALPS